MHVCVVCCVVCVCVIFSVLHQDTDHYHTKCLMLGVLKQKIINKKLMLFSGGVL